MCKKILYFVFAIIFFSAVNLYAVPMTYTYTGPNYNSFYPEESVNYYSTNNNVEVIFTTKDGLLNDTQSLSDISNQINFWHFSDGSNSIYKNMVLPTLEHTLTFNAEALVSDSKISQWKFLSRVELLERDENSDAYKRNHRGIYASQIANGPLYKRRDYSIISYEEWYGDYHESNFELIDYGEHLSQFMTTIIPDGTWQISESTFPNPVPAPVPEPSTFLLLGGGLAGLGFFVRRRRKEE